MPTWVGGPHAIITGTLATQYITKINDSKYCNEDNTITKVPTERWLAAQNFERTGWLECWRHAASDRNYEHATIFNNYISLPDNLGSLLEVGCGPFTQSQTILKNHTATEITLLDPLIEDYKTLEHCPYKTGTLLNYKTTTLQKPLENLTETGFDTIICINVIEHIMDLHKSLNNILNALNNNGILIMGERTNNNFNPLESYDIGHPIVMNRTILEQFKTNFQIIYQNNDYFIGTKCIK